MLALQVSRYTCINASRHIYTHFVCYRKELICSHASVSMVPALGGHPALEVLVLDFGGTDWCQYGQQQAPVLSKIPQLSFARLLNLVFSRGV